jgi:hypothetical protein
VHILFETNLRARKGAVRDKNDRGSEGAIQAFEGEFAVESKSRQY